MIGMGTTIFLVNPVNFGGSSFTNDYSMQFDGVDEDITTTNISALQNVSAFSVSAWFYISSDANCNILRRYAASFNAVIPIAYVSTTSELIARIYNGSSSEGKVTWNPSLNTWYHITTTYDGTQTGNANRLKIYIDGVQQTLSFTTTIPATTANTSATYEITRYRASGKADEFSLFDYALTSGQVTSLYNSGTPTDLDNTSGVTAPVHWWRMGDGSDSYDGTNWTINDVGTTGGNNGTSVNMEVGDRVTDVP